MFQGPNEFFSMVFYLDLADLQYNGQIAKVPMRPKQPGPTVFVWSIIAPCLKFAFVTPDTPDTPEFMAKQRYKTTLPCSEITNCNAA